MWLVGNVAVMGCGAATVMPKLNEFVYPLVGLQVYAYSTVDNVGELCWSILELARQVSQHQSCCPCT